MHHGDVSPEIAAGLLALKKRIAAAKIPPSQLDQTINVAVWNIREFGKKRRTLPAIHYIAEILGQFDLIALVELRDDLTDFGRVCEFLGPSWDLVYSDWMSDPGGNRERTGFLYDRRAVTFNGLAAEVDPEIQRHIDKWKSQGGIQSIASRAAEIAESADFFSFGTNDLTQMTLGFSRDDAGKFLPAYLAKKLVENDPFVSLDQRAVGRLMEIAVKESRARKPGIKYGICGEHGGDPRSIRFCHELGLDYVSCSPYRVPIARIAAAQANVGEELPD